MDTNEIIATSPYKGNELIEHQDEIIMDLVVQWNSIVGDYENQTIKWAMKVKDILAGYPDQTIKQVLEKIRQHPNLRSPMQSKDRIMQGLRLVRNETKIVEWIHKTPEERKLVPESERPYTKDDPALSLQTEFYLLLNKWALDPGLKWELEQKAKSEKWSSRRLMREVQKLREEKAEPNTLRRMQKQSLIREIVFMMKDLQPEELRGIKTFIVHHYKDKIVSWTKWQDNIFKDEVQNGGQK
jgi:hypothetical protein